MSEEILHDAITEFSDLILEGVKGRHRPEVEPLSVFSDRIRANVDGELTVFNERLARGYHVLIEEIAKDGSLKE